jgi:hypothetical protein
MIDYYLAKPTGEIALAILDDKGEVIQRFSSQAKGSSRSMPSEAGMNRLEWDVRYPGGREIPPPPGFVSAEYGRAQAPVAPPGRYRARLSVGGQQFERSFEIVKDPRITATDDDLRAQFELMVRIHERLSDVTDAVNRLRAARQQLAEKPSAEAARALETLGTVEGALTRLLPDVNSMKLPPKALNNRLAALTGAVQQADARPTRQMYAVFDELSAAVSEHVRRLDEVVGTELPALGAR